MMRSVSFKLGVCISIATLMALLLLVRPVRAVWIGSEGQEWLSWDAGTRATYVRAYIHGLQEGYSKGCEAGIAAAQPRLKYDDAVRIHQDCWSRFPISTQDSDKFISSITRFYSTYPNQRFLYISDVLDALHAGRSVEQIHEHFPQSNDVGPK
jgi:hypothetical protein